MRRGVRRIMLVLLAPMLAASVASAATSEAENDVAIRINRERWARSTYGLRLNEGLSSLARRHACDMAAQGRLYHTPNLGRKVKNWKILGENVGVGWDTEVIHQEFMGSEGHRRNILDKRFTQVGAGVCLDEYGDYWVAQIFFG